MKAIIFFANGTEEVEALTPLDYLKRAGVETLLVGVSDILQTGSHGITVKTDVRACDLPKDMDFDLLVFPGGMPGTDNIESSPVARLFLERAAKESKFIGAICAAPKILGARGLLEGKTATCYPGFEKYLVGAKLSDKKAVRCGNIITATGAGAANEFAFLLITALYDEKTADSVARSVRFLI